MWILERLGFGWRHWRWRRIDGFFCCCPAAASGNLMDLATNRSMDLTTSLLLTTMGSKGKEALAPRWFVVVGTRCWGWRRRRDDEQSPLLGLEGEGGVGALADRHRRGEMLRMASSS